MTARQWNAEHFAFTVEPLCVIKDDTSTVVAPGAVLVLHAGPDEYARGAVMLRDAREVLDFVRVLLTTCEDTLSGWPLVDLLNELEHTRETF